MSDPSTPSPRWYRSLYWRIALGLLAFLALMLAAQGALFLWTTDRIAGSMPAQQPAAAGGARRLRHRRGARRRPGLDLEQYVNEQYGNVFQAFVVLMRDGRTVVESRRRAAGSARRAARRCRAALAVPTGGSRAGSDAGRAMRRAAAGVRSIPDARRPFEPGPTRGRAGRSRARVLAARGDAAPIVARRIDGRTCRGAARRAAVLAHRARARSDDGRWSAAACWRSARR